MDVMPTHVDAKNSIEVSLEFVLCQIHLLKQKVWQIQDRRCNSERKRRWRDGETQTTQPDQRPLQVRCNGKDANTDGKYTLVLGQKSNEIAQ